MCLFMSYHPHEPNKRLLSLLRRYIEIQLSGPIQFLARANHLLISITLSLWLLSWITKAFERLARAQQFGASFEVGLQDLAIAGIIVVLVRFSKLRAQKEQLLFAREKDWQRFLQANGLLSYMRVSYLIASCMALTIFSTFCAISTFDNSAKALACLLSNAGQYELAELIYKSAPDLNDNKQSGRYSSMATWHTSATNEDANTIRMKNAAVATVYGSQSLQMAGRYFFLGLTCQQGPVDRDSEAISWHNKALSLYQKNHATTKCVDVLAQMAILQDDNKKQESKRLIAQAVALTPLLDEEPFVCTSIIQYLAERNGDKEQAKILRRGFAKHNPVTEDRPIWAFALLTLLSISSSGVGCLLAKEKALVILAQSAARDCRKAADSEALMNALNELITLNTIRRCENTAELQSLLLLAVADGHRSLGVLQQELSATVETRWAAIYKYELSKVGLALAIVYSFFA